MQTRRAVGASPTYDDGVFLVIRAIEKDDSIDSMKEIIDPVTEDGTSPAYVACKHGHVKCATSLINAGAAAGRFTRAGKLTPIFAAAGKGHALTVEFLLKQRDVRADCRTADGRTPLYAAAEAGSVEVINTLIAANANVDARRKDGSTPLIVAAYLGRVEAVEALLAAGAKLKLRDEDGTALQNAIRQRQTACIELLEKAKKERGHLEAFEEEEDALAVS